MKQLIYNLTPSQRTCYKVPIASIELSPTYEHIKILVRAKGEVNRREMIKEIRNLLFNTILRYYESKGLKMKIVCVNNRKKYNTEMSISNGGA